MAFSPTSSTYPPAPPKFAVSALYIHQEKTRGVSSPSLAERPKCPPPRKSISRPPLHLQMAERAQARLISWSPALPDSSIFYPTEVCTSYSLWLWDISHWAVHSWIHAASHGVEAADWFVTVPFCLRTVTHFQSLIFSQLPSTHI